MASGTSRTQVVSVENLQLHNLAHGQDRKAKVSVQLQGKTVAFEVTVKRDTDKLNIFCKHCKSGIIDRTSKSTIQEGERTLKAYVVSSEALDNRSFFSTFYTLGVGEKQKAIEACSSDKMVQLLADTKITLEGAVVVFILDNLLDDNGNKLKEVASKSSIAISRLISTQEWQQQSCSVKKSLLAQLTKEQLHNVMEKVSDDERLNIVSILLTSNEVEPEIDDGFVLTSNTTVSSKLLSSDQLLNLSHEKLSDIFEDTKLYGDLIDKLTTSELKQLIDILIEPNKSKVVGVALAELKIPMEKARLELLVKHSQPSEEWASIFEGYDDGVFVEFFDQLLNCQFEDQNHLSEILGVIVKNEKLRGQILESGLPKLSSRTVGILGFHLDTVSTKLLLEESISKELSVSKCVSLLVGKRQKVVSPLGQTKKSYELEELKGAFSFKVEDIQRVWNSVAVDKDKWAALLYVCPPAVSKQVVIALIKQDSEVGRNPRYPLPYDAGVTFRHPEDALELYPRLSEETWSSSLFYPSNMLQTRRVNQYETDTRPLLSHIDRQDVRALFQKHPDIETQALIVKQLSPEQVGHFLFDDRLDFEQFISLPPSIQLDLLAKSDGLTLTVSSMFSEKNEGKSENFNALQAEFYERFKQQTLRKSADLIAGFEHKTEEALQLMSLLTPEKQFELLNMIFSLYSDRANSFIEALSRSQKFNQLVCENMEASLSILKRMYDRDAFDFSLFVYEVPAKQREELKGMLKSRYPALKGSFDSYFNDDNS
ncbi:hypothetical protein D5018_17015 [Parashewanella curva]|uniref:Uncharacterized protein n=1 Tax=Parashewanella curva TaxID=2338552 RepID=A0A3L8PTA9_9GAMM|nr:hypothetical protein [Parashewanella curva]RLV58484.1 hypothetical protein D5018_17015 [Parashewanella curva]